MYMQMFFSLEITITPQRDKEIVPPKDKSRKTFMGEQSYLI